MTLVIAGGRHVADPAILLAAVAAFGIFPDEVEEVVCGMAEGADALGHAWATERKIPVREMPADWSYGKRAGPLRNREMAEYAGAARDGRLLLLWDGESKGSRSMLEEARMVGLPTYIWYTQEFNPR